MTIEMNVDKYGVLESSIEVGVYVAKSPKEMLELLDTDYKDKKMPENIVELYAQLDDLSLLWQELKDLAYMEKEAR